MTAEDRALLQAIAGVADRPPRQWARDLRAYYADDARARRTPRGVLVFHLRLLCNLVDNVAAWSNTTNEP